MPCVFYRKQLVELTMLIHVALLLLCYGVGNVRSKTIHENSIDLHSLLDFKQGITRDPNGVLNNWNNNTHYCRWNHVICTQTRPWRVSSLNLTGQSLEGHISSSLGNLSFLAILDLSYNSFVGPLPILNHLQPLQTLYVNNNYLMGPIPDSLTNCSNLVFLDLSVNMLVGGIPRKLALLSNLNYINCKTNHLEGTIPNEFGKLPNLQSLLLGDNRLSGEIPHSIFNLSSLQVLSLEQNMLGHELPPNIALPNIIEITLHHNRFEGPIPASLGNSSGLQDFDLGSNSFTGQVPTFFGKLKRLSTLSLVENNLKATDIEGWDFFNALSNCSSLKVLALYQNQLEGSIPNSIGNLSTGLEQLLLGQNKLSGHVPKSIGKLSALIRLGLSENSLSGTVEGWIEHLNSLQVLRLQSNNFNGPIPPTIGNLTQLIHLNMEHNALEGAIPGSIGNLPGLLGLYLSYNNLQGYIPSIFGNIQQLTFLDLSHNNLQGDIPQVGNLKQLDTIDLSSNMLTGQIHVSLGQCLTLISMRLDQNFLTGNIPITFGNLTTLRMLNLSHNYLSGRIPLPLDQIKSLIDLDLSYNHLQGEIPRNGVFENATAVSLEGNWGLCGGAIDLHMPSCIAASKKTKRGYYLIRVLIPIFGFLSLVLLVYFVLLEKKMLRRTYTSHSLGENFLKVSYADLAQATTNFSESNLVGKGGYGSVYRGELKEPKVEVAVKVFDLEMHDAEQSFLKECEVLRSIQHRNLLPIVTACSTVDHIGNVFKALVYEFMPNGNLDTWLHHREEGKEHKTLSLAQRLSIAVNIADALDYIHHDCGRPTIHCDLKPTNILLDDDMNALLGDFGIASFCQDYWSASTSVGVKGTIGYIAPEYAGGGRYASTSGDVYSFGIILLEMMTGKRPTDPTFKDGVSIVKYVESNFPHEIFQVIDAPLTKECKGNHSDEASKVPENVVHQCLVSWLQVALACTHPIPNERMNMKQIASKIHDIKTSYVRRKAKQYASPEME